ncbi:hypothetical protein MTR_6g043870 [Medicago truncatula]|uniref:Uncharacterized protein n=1 Tax=Medicago truncatula TaxID=3880 RepID=A0A072U9I5_MEDTR|nr:hypothetical protein MTR_6g043870 [Medicago truncatula]
MFLGADGGVYLQALRRSNGEKGEEKKTERSRTLVQQHRAKSKVSTIRGKGKNLFISRI